MWHHCDRGGSAMGVVPLHTTLETDLPSHRRFHQSPDSLSRKDGRKEIFGRADRFGEEETSRESSLVLENQPGSLGLWDRNGRKDNIPNPTKPNQQTFCPGFQRFSNTGSFPFPVPGFVKFGSHSLQCVDGEASLDFHRWGVGWVCVTCQQPDIAICLARSPSMISCQPRPVPQADVGCCWSQLFYFYWHIFLLFFQPILSISGLWYFSCRCLPSSLRWQRQQMKC